MGLVSIGLICLVVLPFELFFTIDGWVKLFAVGIASGILALVVNFFVVLRASERQMVLNLIRSKLVRK